MPTGQEIGDGIVFARLMLGIDGDIYLHHYFSQMAGQLLMDWADGGIKIGAVQPTHC